LTFLAEELEKAEARFNLTRREVRGNSWLGKRRKEMLVGRRREVDGKFRAGWKMVLRSSPDRTLIILMYVVGSQNQYWRATTGSGGGLGYVAFGLLCCYYYK
jgi:hypothetical protein